MTGMSNMRVYSRARRISMAVATGWPSSVIATQPACRSSAMSASCSPCCPRDTAPIGSTTRPPFSNIIGVPSLISLAATGQQVQHRHADGDAVRDLLEYHGVGTVRDFGVDLDAAVHRPGMHDDDVGLRARDARLGHAE